MKCALSGILSLVAMMLLTGCNTVPKSDYDLVDLVVASGTITLDDKPLAGAVVTFESPNGQFSYALTNSSGHYVLQFDTVKKGVTPGSKTVRVSTARRIVGLNSDSESGDPAGEVGEEGTAPKLQASELVPDKYHRSSELKVEVTPDKSVYDFQLSSR
ncbi:MAG: hypothetical protein JWM11_2849 [Planctomycetaceae bacterium]|nr:hypothetical protein [Planctomycetaceae bacterium]